MKNSISKTLVIALLAGLSGTAAITLRAAEAPAAPAPTPAPVPAKQATRQQLAGKVVAVDPKGNTVTVEVNGKTYVLQVDKKTRITKAGKDGKPVHQVVDDIKVGEDLNVTVEVAELANGQMEVSVVAIESAPVEASGKGNGKTPPRGRSGPPLPFPGNGTPNPANIDGNVNSPNN